MPGTSFDETRFTAGQIAELKASAISPEIADRAGLYSIDDAKAAAKQFGRLAKHWEGHLPVLVYPYRIPFQRDPVLVRGKPARPFEHRANDGSAKLEKYVQAKDTGVHIAFGPSLLEGPALRDVNVPLIITEGEKKMLAAESHGFSCIALPGVTQWHVKGQKTQLHPYFAHVRLEGRSVWLAFDADSLSNKDVRKQELALGRALEKAGAKVYVLRFPPDAGKLDDYLATHELTEFAALIEDARVHGKLPPDTNGVTEDWQPVFGRLRLDADTQLPIKDGDNVARILMHHPAWAGVLAFDARRERQLFVKAPPFAEDVTVPKAAIPRPLSDSDVTRVGTWLVGQTCLGWSTMPKTAQIDQALAVVCERHRVDAVRDYLVGLTWDGTSRLDSMAATYFGTEDTPYARNVWAKWMLSAVARVRTPGCQVDHVLVLEGPQGIGKSTAFRILAGGGDLFSDTLPEIPSRDAHEHCIGPWIIELAELDHMRKSEVTALKAFISARAPSFRSAYGRRTAEHPRRCVFGATTNESSYLADSTGNRRFWPVTCTKVDAEGLARDRDQLWAEALARVRAGESWHITDPEVVADVEEEQAARRQVDPWHPVVAKYVAKKTVVTVGDVLDHLGHEPSESGWSGYKGERSPQRWRYDQRSANRVAAILRDLGWIRRLVRVDGHRVWQYEHEGGVTSSRQSGTTVVTGQVLEFKGLSPVSPVSPVKSPSNTDAHARPTDTGTTGDTRARESSNPSIVIKEYTGDSGDSGDNTVVTDSYHGTSKSPVSGGSGDTAAAKPRRRL